MIFLEIIPVHFALPCFPAITMPKLQATLSTMSRASTPAVTTAHSERKFHLFSLLYSIVRHKEERKKIIKLKVYLCTRFIVCLFVIAFIQHSFIWMTMSTICSSTTFGNLILIWCIKNRMVTTTLHRSGSFQGNVDKHKWEKKDRQRKKWANLYWLICFIDHFFYWRDTHIYIHTFRIIGT